MRILILNQYALPAGEAGITRHGDIGAELVRRGHEVTVVASDFDYFTRQHVERTATGHTTSHDGVRFHWLRTGQYDANDRRRFRSGPIRPPVTGYPRSGDATSAGGSGRVDRDVCAECGADAERFWRINIGADAASARLAVARRRT